MEQTKPKSKKTLIRTEYATTYDEIRTWDYNNGGFRYNTPELPDDQPGWHLVGCASTDGHVAWYWERVIA